MQLKQSINMYLLASMQINMFIEEMNKDSIFTVSVEQYLLRSKRKILRKTTHVYTIYFSRTYVLEREKRRKCTANAALI